MSKESNRTSDNGRQTDNYPTDNYPTDSHTAGHDPADHHTADHSPANYHAGDSTKDSSRYSHPDTRPDRNGPGGES